MLIFVCWQSTQHTARKFQKLNLKPAMVQWAKGNGQLCSVAVRYTGTQALAIRLLCVRFYYVICESSKPCRVALALRNSSGSGSGSVAVAYSSVRTSSHMGYELIL